MAELDSLKQSLGQLTEASAVLLQPVLSGLSVDGDQIAVCDISAVRDSIGAVAEIAAFAVDDDKIIAHRLAWNVALQCGIYPASIDSLYRKIALGDIRPFTVPAVNMRAIAYHSARGVMQAMREHQVGALIFELSRGEIGFTGQRPMEYATVILCAAIAEAHSGPLFLQGDHFQISATRYQQDAMTEVQSVKSLIAEAVSAGFYNIDIDASTLVDLSRVSIDEQQRTNYELTSELAAFTRQIEPEGVCISLGGEIGEVGEQNSTVVEVQAYLKGTHRLLGDELAGLSKLSIQSGTKHGGNILPDGSVGEMNVDFGLIGQLTGACRHDGGLAGCVQHGASMLSLAKLAQLADAGCIEVHLAAAFLNAVYEQLPAPIVEQTDRWLYANFLHEWKDGWSDAQFLHHVRRLSVAHFKREWWDATECHESLRKLVREKAASYIVALKVENTVQLVAETIHHLPVAWSEPRTQSSTISEESGIDDLAS